MREKSFIKKAAIVILISIGFTALVTAQNVAITDDDTYSANDAAMLDIKSTSKGLLIPRVALLSANNPISATKPEGLLIWNSSASVYAIGYYYWNGADWSPVGAAVGNGLTLAGSKIELGGTLEKTTTISTGGNLMKFDVNGAGNLNIDLTSTGDFTVFDNGSTSSCFTFQDNGSVGIGTTSPLHTLHASGLNANTAGTDGVYIDLQNTSTSLNVQTGIRFANNSSTTNAFRAGLFFRRTDSPVSIDGDLYLANKSAANVTYADAALIVKPDKKIGIGTNTPAALLHVNGDAKLSSGAAVNEFSTDGTLAGNSDLAVPTEKATKTYVDNKAGAGFSGTGTLNYIPRWTSTTGLGSSILYQSTNKIGIGTTTPTSKLVVYGNNGLTDDDAIFEVKNDAGQTVFAVYPKGVRVNVDQSLAKGARGGFAVGNLAAGKLEEEFFRVTRDSVRIWVSETAKSTRGGFAVGNLAAGKGTTSIMSIEKENYFIGHNSGTKSTGQYNNFFGYEAGRDNLTGVSNVFIGYWAGLLNTTGRYNVNIGNASGYQNTTGENNVNIGLFTGAFNKSANNNISIGNYAGIGGLNYSGGYNNIFLGVSTGYSIRGGHDNNFIGKKAGYKITEGYSNVILGDSAGYDLTTGYHNTMVGSESGIKTSTNTENTYLGYTAGVSMNGTRNTFIGSKSGGAATPDAVTAGSGSYNAGLGYYTLFSLTTGSNNATLGCYSGQYNLVGSGNTMLGFSAGRFNTGDGNVFVGNYAGGNSSFASYSDRFVVDNVSSSTIDDVLIYGEFESYDATANNEKLQFNANIGVRIAASSSYGVYVNKDDTPGSGYGIYAAGGSRGIYARATGTTGTTAYGVYGYATGGTTNWAGYFNGDVNITGSTTKSSDERLKMNIEIIPNALNKIMTLKGVTYNWKSQQELITLFGKGDNKNEPEEENNKFNYSTDKQVGVIAQDVEKVFPELVKSDGDGIKSVNYEGLIPILIEAIKEQQKQIDNQNKEIEKLKADMPKSSVAE